ncbi:MULTISPECIES: thymidylate synthase [Pseudobutyrivibrio]|uniref:Thymidylate synthase n=1 Tax=Pseudobutyrivibrio xylanivorans TaxID=185007 RepID=A0A1G5S5I3_PSEXY|nr:MULTISPECIES: thymidylate synthase [Pseudobutyrivibrio]MDC7280659.1 thymidylate synthase [Butyrivibrio fibrisolvens]SCZ80809.1 thymidylate synthase [Pseudobutyrivibrio xylanivorans]
MSKADVIFKAMCRDILENGTDTKDEIVRPIWEDTGEKAYTIKQFGVVNKYDLREEFPALTLRKTALKTAMDEILWIYQRKSNNIKDLKAHIWDEWADENGSIGTAYGYVVGEKFEFKGEMIDQMDYVLKQLKETPYSRRIMTNLYQFHDLATGHLDPCCYSATYNVTKDKNSDKLVLNMVLNQRSQDILAANNWNVCQYAILLMMVAQVNDMIPGQLIHVIADAHIYDRHVDIIKELIERPELPAPTVRLNPEVKNFYDFTTDDLIVEGYEAGEQIKNIPIAV